MEGWIGTWWTAAPYLAADAPGHPNARDRGYIGCPEFGYTNRSPTGKENHDSSLLISTSRPGIVNVGFARFFFPMKFYERRFHSAGRDCRSQMNTERSVKLSPISRNDLIENTFRSVSFSSKRDTLKMKLLPLLTLRLELLDKLSLSSNESTSALRRFPFDSPLGTARSS